MPFLPPLLLALLLSSLAPCALADPAARLVASAREQIGVTVHYDGSYRKLAYPGGDVAPDRGVCTDVIVRAYRQLGIDLQQRVHNDMRAARAHYPQHWGSKGTDTNIDHRRVPNLETYFRRQGAALPVTHKAADFKLGDIVTWTLPPALPHIGIVADTFSADGTPLIIHNVGVGTQLEDVLFAYKMVGHYRYLPQRPAAR